MSKNRILMAGMIFVGIIGFFPGWSAGDTYPSRPLSMVVPFPPGGVADLTARPLAVVMEPQLKQPVAVVNKPGAGGVVGMQFVAPHWDESSLISMGEEWEGVFTLRTPEVVQ